jgi:hypothetical protein
MYSIVYCGETRTQGESREQGEMTEQESFEAFSWNFLKRKFWRALMQMKPANEHSRWLKITGLVLRSMTIDFSPLSRIFVVPSR